MAIKIALAGNPNCGKTTMFNALTGANQYVGNWPGVTVEKKEGKCKENKDVIVTDLPGIYSLSPYTLEEVVSRDYLLKEKPEAIINLVDATNIERNLYLTTQLLELGIPVVIALNMADLLEKNKISIDTKALEKELGCKVVKTSALKGTGIHEVVKEAVTAAKKESIVSGKIKFSKDTEAAVSEMEGQLPSSVLKEQKKWYAIKLLERDAKVLEQLKLTASVQNQVEKIAARLEEKLDDDTESIITNERYEAITHVVEKCVKKPKEKLSTSDKIDQIVTNRILGLPIFLGVMYVVYAIAVMTIGTYVTDWTNDVLVVAIQDAAASGLQAIGTAAFLEDLIVNGIIGGLGAVLGFLPQMAILFVLLSILEDCGYMVRVAFVMDRIFRKFGLSGKSFIPLLISSGCGIPGIMASKTIENDNDRRLTIMTSTFVPCGAKLPVIALMAGVIGSEATGFPAGALTFIMYVIGVAAVLVSAIILKKTKPFHGDAAPFVMELPAYHLPQAKTVLIHTWERLKGFIRKAGTIL
ncbi:MAG: ferrous iron transport protein B, partial [Mediterraneibacter gnavus]